MFFLKALMDLFSMVLLGVLLESIFGWDFAPSVRSGAENLGESGTAGKIWKLSEDSIDRGLLRAVSVEFSVRCRSATSVRTSAEIKNDVVVWETLSSLHKLPFPNVSHKGKNKSGQKSTDRSTGRFTGSEAPFAINLSWLKLSWLRHFSRLVYKVNWTLIT